MNKIELLLMRSKIENKIRSYLLKKSFIEVRTPIINKYPDVTPVRQFQTHTFDTNQNLYLRIAPTEFLKRLIFDGLNCIFEFSVNFRDDCNDSTHLSEFLSLEIMRKDNDVYDMIELSECLIKDVLEFVYQHGYNNDFVKSRKNNWPKIVLRDYLLENYDFYEIDNFEELQILYKKICGNDANNIKPMKTKYDFLDAIILKISCNYRTPVYIGEFPWYLGGPARPTNDNMLFKERYELYYRGIELANMSSNLTEYKLLLKWYSESLSSKRGIINDECSLDLPLFEVFKYGMPNGAVCGIGLDRLISLVFSINDVRKTTSYIGF